MGIADKRVEAVAAERLSICAACPTNTRTGDICDKEKGGCGCPLESKCRSMASKCPKGHWDKVVLGKIPK